MSKFSEIAKQARESHEKKLAEGAAKSKAEAEARKTQVDAAIAQLNNYVVPQLREAQAALLDQGIEFRIEEHYDVYNRHSTVMPTITAGCYGPKRPGDGFQLGSTKIFFLSDGSRIKVGAGKDAYSTEMERDINWATTDNVDPLIEKAVRLAVDAYYPEMERHGYLRKTR